jgi:hypothetical protein
LKLENFRNSKKENSFNHCSLVSTRPFWFVQGVQDEAYSTSLIDQ